jgi:iron-sulfur cluster assembly protein/iron-sulfur cluster insertion protein
MSIATSVNISKKPEPVVLSDLAVSKVAELLASEENGSELALRIAVKAGGCSGFQYDMFFDSDIEESDVITTFGDVRVVVDAESATMLSGASLDYQDGLNGAGFHITNPNASRTCGCGNSFN